MERKVTPVLKRSLNPVWNQVFEFEVPIEKIRATSLCFNVKDHEEVFPNKLIGKTMVGHHCAGTSLKHWTDMLNNPRKAIAMWHTIVKWCCGKPCYPKYFFDLFLPKMSTLWVILPGVESFFLFWPEGGFWSRCTYIQYAICQYRWYIVTWGKIVRFWRSTPLKISTRRAENDEHSADVWFWSEHP